jgi:hypothetical protein
MTIHNSKMECPVCYNETSVYQTLQCGHEFCIGCSETWFKLKQSCPICRAKIKYTYSNNIGNGKFLYIKSDTSRTMLQSAHKAITKTNMWDFVAQDVIESFTSPEIKIILDAIDDVGFSGSSFGWTMSMMQKLAREGEGEFMNSFLSTL